MSIHILCLNILLLCATCYPAAIPQIFLPYLSRYAGKKSNTIYLFGCNILYLVLFLISLTIVSVPVEFISGKSIWWYGVAILSGGFIIALEFGVGKSVMALEGKKTKGISLNASYKDVSMLTCVLTLLLAICEEVIFRWVWGAVLLHQLGVPVWGFVLLSAFFYAINHLYYGMETFIQKLVTGILFTLLFYLSGNHILIPMLAHIMQNLILLIAGRSRKSE